MEPFGWTVTITCRELNRVAANPDEAKAMAWAALTNLLRRAGLNVENALQRMPGWVE